MINAIIRERRLLIVDSLIVDSLYGTPSYSSPRATHKGYPLLEQALARRTARRGRHGGRPSQKEIELRIFGGDEKENIRCPPPPVFSTFLGRIDDPEKLRDEYCAADCFAFPSTSETMGMTKLEALACGCPVVAFDRTACAEGIVHLQTGYIAKDGDLPDYAQGIIWCLSRRSKIT